MTERILIVAPSWVGDAILSEPLIALLHEQYREATVDVLALPWCAPVYERMRGVDRIIESPFAHGKLALGARFTLARSLRNDNPESRYTRAIVLPNSWKSALVPWLAHIPQRTGYKGEARWGLLNDARRLDRKRLPRLADRFAALCVARRAAAPATPRPVLIPDRANADACLTALGLDDDRPIAILCPGAEYGPAKRWPPEHFAALANRFIDDGLEVWLIGSPNDKPASAAVLAAVRDKAHLLRDLTGLTDIGTAIDLLSLASIVVSNDSGLMHAAAAVSAPLVALFGSSSTQYTPPLSKRAKIARIDIACSPCYQRECPLGHFKCMRELEPSAVYHLARDVRSGS